MRSLMLAMLVFGAGLIPVGAEFSPNVARAMGNAIADAVEKVMPSFGRAEPSVR